MIHEEWLWNYVEHVPREKETANKTELVFIARAFSVANENIWNHHVKYADSRLSLFYQKGPYNVSTLKIEHE